MNRGVLQSSPVQQMMASGNPNWWNINGIRPPVVQQTSPFLAPPNLFPPFAPQPSPSPPPPSSSSWNDYNQEFPESLSQLLLGGFVGEEDKSSTMMHMQAKKLDNWEEQQLIQTKNGAHIYGQRRGNVEFQGEAKPNWTRMLPLSSSSPKSCITTTLSSNNMLDFSNKTDRRHPPPDRSSESNSNANGGTAKKARVQCSSTQSNFKVRKEKLGDRINALHQIVSPFGKTDTASVLLEAIGYIRFLQSQIEALSLPYLASGSGNMSQKQQQSLSLQSGETNNSLFPEQDPGQLLNDNCLKRKGRTTDHQQDSHELEPKKDLRSRGLWLVPISCTLQVGSDNGADYWASALGGGFQ